MTACSVALKGVAFFSTPLFTRLLSTEEYGKLSVIMTYDKLLLLLATMELGYAPFTRAYYKYRGDTGGVLNAVLLASVVLTLAVYAAILAVRDWFCEVSGFSESMLLYAFLYALFQPAYICWFNIQRIQYRYKKQVVATLTLTILQTAIPLAALLLLGRTAEIKYVYAALPQILIFVFFFLKKFRFREFAKTHWHALREYWNLYLHVGPPYFVNALSYMVLNQADRVMIGNMSGNTPAAIYSIAYSVAMVTSLLQSSVSQVLYPWMFDKLEKKETRKMRKHIYILLVAMASLYLAYMLVCPELIRLLFSSEYRESVWCIPPIIGSSFFMLIYSIFINIESYYEKNSYVTVTAVVCSVVNIVLNYFGIKLFGYATCAYTTLISYMLFALMHFLFAKKSSSGKSLVSGHRLVIVSILFLAGMACITFLYDHVALRYLAVATFGIFVIIKREPLVQLMKKLRR